MDSPQEKKSPPYSNMSDKPENKDKQGSEDSLGSTESTPGKQSPPDVYFIIPRTVTLVYGPYSYEGIMDYRTERLQGIKTYLEKHGVTVTMKPCLDHVNFVRVWFLDELLFSCQITQLAHGGDGELDPLCWEAVDALENYIKMVLKGLRESQPAGGSEELKRPFCPCFHVGDKSSPSASHGKHGTGPSCCH